MKTLYKLLILLLSFSTFVTKPSEDLEQAIVKTDLVGVKTLLAQIKLDSVTKNRLLDLADNIILMRMKYVEIYSCKQITQADFDSICEALSKGTIQEIKNMSQAGYSLERKHTFWVICSIIFLCIDGGFCEVMKGPNIMQDPNVVSLGICLLGAIAGTALSFKRLSDIVTALRDVNNAEHKCVRENLQKNYSDAILVKQLLLQASVVDTMVYRRFVD
jgi:hypothetical protein